METTVVTSVDSARAASRSRVSLARSSGESQFNDVLKVVLESNAALIVRLGALESLVMTNEVSTRKDIAALSASDHAQTVSIKTIIDMQHAEGLERMTLASQLEKTQKILDEKIAAFSAQIVSLRHDLGRHSHMMMHGDCSVGRVTY